MSKGDDDVRGIPRRVFLAYGPASMAAFWLKPAGIRLARPDHIRDDAASPISVGYCPWSDTGATDAVAADSIKKGDPTFLDTGARMTILGMSPVAPDSDLASLSVDILYDIAGHAEPLRVHAWRFTNGALPHYSPGNSFVVQIDRNKPLRIVVETTDRSGGRASRMCRFTTGTESGLPKLMRGTYFLAPADSPAWRRIEWRPIGAGASRLFDKARLDGPATLAKFPHVAMTLDYLRPPARATGPVPQA